MDDKAVRASGVQQGVRHYDGFLYKNNAMEQRVVQCSVAKLNVKSKSVCEGGSICLHSTRPAIQLTHGESVVSQRHIISERVAGTQPLQVI